MTDFQGSIQDRQNNSDRGGDLVDRMEERERFAEVTAKIPTVTRVKDQPTTVVIQPISKPSLVSLRCRCCNAKA